MMGPAHGGWAAYPNAARFPSYLTPNPHATAAAVRAQALQGSSVTSSGSISNVAGSTTPPGGLNMVKVIYVTRSSVQPQHALNLKIRRLREGNQ